MQHHIAEVMDGYHWIIHVITAYTTDLCLFWHDVQAPLSPILTFCYLIMLSEQIIQEYPELAQS